MVKSYHNKKGLRNLRNLLKFGGAKRDRTADLLNHIQKHGHFPRVPLAALFSLIVS